MAKLPFLERRVEPVNIKTWMSQAGMHDDEHERFSLFSLEFIKFTKII